MDITCTCGNTEIVGIEVQGVYDGILIWHCLACQRMWPRFDEGTWKWSKALDYIQEAEER